MQLSEFDEIVKQEFLSMNDYNPRATIDEWVIMPNHVHCVITLGEFDIVDGADSVEKISCAELVPRFVNFLYKQNPKQI